MRSIAFAACMAIGMPVASAQEFGQFIGNPKGEFIQGADRPLFKLHEDFVYRDPNGLEWVAPKGEVVDGASIPWYAWSLVGGPFEGPYLNAAIIHDYYCCAKNREYHSTHHTFFLGMRAAGASEAMAWTFWTAVRLLGPDFWSVDPASSAPSPCKTATDVVAALRELDEGTRAIALGKFLAIARTLNTTDGQVLDIVNGSIVKSGTKEAEEHINFLNDAIVKKFDVDQDKLGTVTVVTEAEFKAFSERNVLAISPWVQGQIPSLDEYMRFAGLEYPEGVKVEGAFYAPFVANDPFKLEINDFAIGLVEK